MSAQLETVSPEASLTPSVWSDIATSLAMLERSRRERLTRELPEPRAKAASCDAVRKREKTRVSRDKKRDSERFSTAAAAAGTDASQQFHVKKKSDDTVLKVPIQEDLSLLLPEEYKKQNVLLEPATDDDVATSLAQDVAAESLGQRDFSAFPESDLDDVIEELSFEVQDQLIDHMALATAANGVNAQPMPPHFCAGFDTKTACLGASLRTPWSLEEADDLEFWNCPTGAASSQPSKSPGTEASGASKLTPEEAHSAPESSLMASSVRKKRGLKTLGWFSSTFQMKPPDRER